LDIHGDYLDGSLRGGLDFVFNIGGPYQKDKPNKLSRQTRRLVMLATRAFQSNAGGREVV